MADIPARTELPASDSEPGVTTGPIRGSRKIHVGPNVASRCARSTSSRARASRRSTLYDTSGPYTDPAVTIDIMRRPRRASPRLDPRPRRCRGSRSARNPARGQWPSSAPTGQAASPPSPTCASACSARGQAITSARCIMPAAGSSPPKWNMSRRAKTSAARCFADHVARRRGFRRLDPRPCHARIRPRRGRPRPRHHPQQHQPPRIRADGDRPQLPGQDQRQHRQLARSRPTSLPRSTRWCGRAAGARTRSWTCRPAATSTTPANGSSAIRPSRSAPSPSTRRSRRSAASPRT